MACPKPTFFSLSCRCPADSSEAMETILGCQRRACSKARSTLAPAARLVTAKRSGKASTIFSVLLPMDPVEPRMAMCLMSGSDNGNPRGQSDAGEIPAQTGDVKNHSDRQSEEQGIDSVQHSTVAGQQRPGVLYAGAALEGRFHEI